MHQIIIFCAKYLFIFVVLVFAWAWFKAPMRYKRQMAAAIIFAGIAAAIFDKISAKLYYDPRPFVTHHVTPLVAHAADNGFPSEHTLFTFTISAVLFFYRPKLSYLAFGLSALVGIGRVAAHVHSPIDILGAIVFGLISGCIGYYLAKSLGRRFKSLKA